jgi:hypothetical protein
LATAQWYRILSTLDWRTHLDERAQIAWLRKQVDEPIPEDVIALLREDHYFTDEGDDALELLLRRAHRLLQMTVKTRREKLARTALPSPSERELRNLARSDVMRRDAISEYSAMDASTRIEVKRFRGDVLGGELLNDREALRFLESPAAQAFSVSALRTAGIDPVRHEAELLKEQGDPQKSYHAAVRANGSTLEFSSTGSERNEWQVRLGGRLLSLRVWDGSVIHDLRRVASILRYTWREGEAEWFILTGRTPVLSALAHSYDIHVASHGNRAVINLRVDAWVSAERVLALYRELQKAILRNRHNRPISERRLTLFRFVTEHADDEGEIPPWRTLLPEWNQRHKKWTYKNVRNFSRDYWAAARLLLFPKYNLNMGEVRG